MFCFLDDDGHKNTYHARVLEDVTVVISILALANVATFRTGFQCASQ